MKLQVIFLKYLSIKQTADKWGGSTRRIQILCNTNRIAGAVKIGSFWAVPESAAKPKDKRIRSGKYVKNEIEKDVCK